MNPSVLIVNNSENRKLSNKNSIISATYVSQSTCPKNCPLYRGGCYAEYGEMGFWTRHLNKSTTTNIIKIAKEEAKGIELLPAKKPLRLHVVGDCSTPKTARIVSSAAEKYIAKHNSPVWTYTHGRVKRECWGNVSVLRSCHTIRQTQNAHEAGYASALVVKEFKDTKKHYIGRGMYGIPCVNQVSDKNITCDKCKLCMKDKYLHSKNIVILFRTHGTGNKKANKYAV